MKTILCSSYQKDQIYHELAKKNQGIVTDIRMVSLSDLMKAEGEENRAAALFSAARLLQEHASEFPLFRNMFAFPAFSEEVVSFARQLALYQIPVEDLPKRNPSEAELSRILALIMRLPMKEKEYGKNRKQYLEQISAIENLSLYPAFETDYFSYAFRRDLKQSGIPVVKEEQPSPSLSLCYALNARQELESIAQDICRKNVSCTIILASYSTQLPVLKQVFMRYGIPWSAVKENTELHIPKIFAAAARFAWKKDVSSLLEMFRIDAFPSFCPDSLYPFLRQTMTDPEAPSGIAEALQNSPLSKDAPYYADKQKQVAAYFRTIEEELQLLKQADSPKEILKAAYAVMKRSPFLNSSPELQAARSIMELLQEVLPDVQSEADLSFVIELMESIQDSESGKPQDFCMVTDQTHPVRIAENTYVAGCSGQNWPGFPVCKGLFDESYVSCLKQYPSMEQRHDAYSSQLEWVMHSAREHVYFSCPTNDYQGRGIELAFEIESMFPKHSALRWKLEVLKPAQAGKHELSPDTAAALFEQDGKIHGSISSIERWFACPYSYFIESGLKVRPLRLTDRDSAGTGTIQHAVLEHSVKRYGKNYAEISEEEIAQILHPYYEALKTAYPHSEEELSLSEARMMENLKQSFCFLKDMEANTSYEPAEEEHAFADEIIPGIELRGIIDRIDTCGNLMRIVDYKSSDKTLSEKKVKAGMQLQLLTYLIIARKYRHQIPGGAYYFSLKPCTYPLSAAKLSRGAITETMMDEESLKKQFLNVRRMAGWTFDREHLTELDASETHIVSGTKTFYDFGLSEKCMEEVYDYFRNHLLDGSIELSPAENACMFCRYRCICRFQGDFRVPVPLVMQDTELKIGKENG